MNKPSLFMRTIVLFCLVVMGWGCKNNAPHTSMCAIIQREDGYSIVFNMEEQRTDTSRIWVIRNGEERIEVSDIEERGDSLVVHLPFFEAEFRLKTTSTGYTGTWSKATSKGWQTMPIDIEYGEGRYALASTKQRVPITGGWRVEFSKPDGRKGIAKAEFQIKGDTLLGTFLTPTGDYRFLEGTFNGDSMLLSTFDGTHAFFFSARLSEEGQLVNGIFASGPTHVEQWTAVRDEAMQIVESTAAMQVKNAESRLDFVFSDLDGNRVGINDDRFKGKVVVVQIMGSWCPNCMDETQFLSSFYTEYASKGVEVIGLAYEYTTDSIRARKNLDRFRKKFDVRYPMLITGVTSSDSLKTEKTLPQMTPIKAYPSMIFIGKDGMVRKTHAGYSGPATGKHHEAFKEEFKSVIDALVSEPLN